MYSPTFWQDHVTEFDNRFREQNNNDGTITHIPIEGAVIQEGTPQNAANFNNIEMGIFAANEIAAELMRIALQRDNDTGGTGGGGSGSESGESENATNVLYQQIEIPAIGWEISESGYYIDIPIEGAAEGMIPVVDIENGEDFNIVTGDGFIRLSTNTVPEEPISTNITLLSPSAGSSGGILSLLITTTKRLDNVMNKVSSLESSVSDINFSIPVSAWTASEDIAFPFAAEIVNESVTADHIAHFVFDKASILAAMEAVIITGDTSEGKITLLAKEAPTVDLSGAYKITRKGAIE